MDGETTTAAAALLEREWAESARWQGIERPYSAQDVVRAARLGPRRAHARPARRRAAAGSSCTSATHVRALGAMTGGQAVQMVKAGLEAIYLSGWQVAADANLAGQTYPDQSLYPANSVPGARAAHQQRAAARRPDRTAAEGANGANWLAPIVADAEAGFGGPLNAFELMKAMIEAGCRRACTSRTSSPPRRSAATSAARCSSRPRSSSARSPRRGSPPTSRACRRWSSLARTRSRATLLTSDVDERDARFLTGERTAEGFFRVRAGIDCGHRPRRSPTRRTPTCSGSRPRRPTSTRPARSRQAIHERFPGKLLAYNCSPSFNWRAHLDDARSRGSSASSARWATGSSSSRSPASTR